MLATSQRKDLKKAILSLKWYNPRIINFIYQNINEIKVTMNEVFFIIFRKYICMLLYILFDFGNYLRG